VRAADVEYKLPGESVFRMTTRPIHKLVLIIPIEEQISATGETRKAEAAPLEPECAEAEPKTESQEEPGAKEEASSTETMPPPLPK
jgi:hypothetical protein